MTWPPLLPRHEAQARLRLLFPAEAFDPVLANPLAASAIAAMLYVNAVVPDTGPVDADATWARPSMCLWMSDQAYAQDDPAERAAWLKAALRGRKAVASALAEWGMSHEPWYGDNSRETVRDETFSEWLEHGALRVHPGVPTTSSRPRWALTANFAALFDPGLSGDRLSDAIEAWRGSHMTPGDRLRISTLQERDRATHQISVTLPNREVRLLEPGQASLILKGVIESWAPVRLADPVVLTISEPGDKVYVADAARLRALNLTVDASSLLPDAVIVDIAATPPTFWIIEAVATDGPVTEDRRRQLLRWAEQQRIPSHSCRFISAFASRNSPPAKRRLKDLAADSYAWYADEPGRELAWYKIAPS